MKLAHHFLRTPGKCSLMELVYRIPALKQLFCEACKKLQRTRRDKWIEDTSTNWQRTWKFSIFTYPVIEAMASLPWFCHDHAHTRPSWHGQDKAAKTVAKLSRLLMILTRIAWHIEAWNAFQDDAKIIKRLPCSKDHEKTAIIFRNHGKAVLQWSLVMQK